MLKKFFRYARYIFPALILASLGLRFLFMGSASFINDEPNLQLKLDGYLADNHLPLIGISGSQPIPYGPIAMWIYAAIRLFSENHFWILFVYILIQNLSFLFIWRSLRKIFDPLAADITACLFCTSGYLYYYSRHLWDNTFLILFSSLIFYLIADLYFTRSKISSQKSKYWKLAGIGFLSGACIGTHLASFSLVIPLVLLILVKEGIPWPQLKKNILFIGSGAAASLLPYVAGLIKHDINLKVRPSQFSKHIEHLETIALGPSRILSNLDWMNYYFDTWNRPTLVEQSGLDRFIIWNDWLLLLVRKGLLIALFGFTIYAGIQFFKKKTLSPVNFLLILCGSISVCQVWIYARMGLFEHPHYYHFIWWIPCVILGFLISNGPKWLRHSLIVILLSLIFTNSITLSRGIAFVVNNHGVRNLSYGASIDEQMSAIKKICEQTTKEQVEINISPVIILPVSLEYFFKREPSCHGKKFAIVGSNTESLIYYAKAEPSAEFLVKVNHPAP